MSTREAEALAAIDRIIDDFTHHRRDAYFAGFAEDATFLFHNEAELLVGRAAYESRWPRWEADEGFRVRGGTSTRRHLQLLGDNVAVFSHDVTTDLADGDGTRTLNERETIVVEKREGRWVAVHEHLSRAE